MDCKQGHRVDQELFNFKTCVPVGAAFYCLLLLPVKALSFVTPFCSLLKLCNYNSFAQVHKSLAFVMAKLHMQKFHSNLKSVAVHFVICVVFHDYVMHEGELVSTL